MSENDEFDPITAGDTEGETTKTESPTKATGKTKTATKSKPKVERKRALISIHKDARAHAVDPVPVALNGIQYTIRRGEEVEVPVELLEVLDQAEEIRYEQVANRDGSVTMVPRKALSYPYQLIRRL